MAPLSKFCDAADWFRNDMQDVIRNELREMPRFHRKQWESAMIFLTLRNLGKLRPDSFGLSMGGGKELIAYALAPHTKHLVITDLYEVNTSWDCAKTSNPDEFIRQNKPFPVNDERMSALRMDMRHLEFPDGTFDFCYSTCAVEHIGGPEDFLQHFNEVARVLNDDGIYVFTTEVSYDRTSIQDDHNYIFSLPLLYELIGESNLVPIGDYDARISHHKINFPIPSTLKQLTHFVTDSLPERVLQEAPHIQLLRGKHPFTCGVFVLQKRARAQTDDSSHIIGLDQSQRFVQEGVREFSAMLMNTRVAVNPFALLPGERSRYFADHAEFFAQSSRTEGDPETPFHTDYFWWGNGKRVFDISMRVDGASVLGTPELELRIHRFRTLASRDVDCVSSSSQPVRRHGWLVRTFEVDTDDDYCYAILAKVRQGACMFDRIEIKSYSAHLLRSASNGTALGVERISGTTPMVVHQ